VSQYPYPPPPYTPPLVGWLAWSPPQNLLRPARLASIMQSIFGSLASLFGIAAAAVAWAGDMKNSVERIHESGMNEWVYPGMTAEQSLRIALTVNGGLLFVVGLTLLTLSYFVYRAQVFATIASIVVNGLVVMVLVAQLVSSLFLLSGVPGLAMEAVVYLLVTAWCARTIMALWSAMRLAYQIRALRLSQAGEFWNFQHRTGLGLTYQPLGGTPAHLQPPATFTPPSH
jgi:hypothetical protein